MPATGSVQRFVRAVLLEDWPLKIACFVLATLYWFYIDGQLTGTREITVQVSLKKMKLPEGYRLEDPEKKFTVHVKLRGPRQSLQFLDETAVRLSDFRGLLVKPKQGLNTIALDRERFKTKDKGMDVVAVLEPRNLEVNLQQTYFRDVRVLVQVKSDEEPASGYEVNDSNATPPEVLVTALEDLTEARYVLTAPVSIAGRSEDFEQEVKISPVVTVGEGENERKIVGSSTKSVWVKIFIRQKESNHILENIPVQTLAPPGFAMTVEPAHLSVLVKGPALQIANLGQHPIRIYVEWPPEWSTDVPVAEAFKERTVQVKVMPRPGLTITGKDEKPLTVKIRGTRSALLKNE